MKYNCEYCDLWNIYTGKCSYECCPLEDGAEIAFAGRGIKPQWEKQWEQDATPEDWRKFSEDQARNEPTEEEWEKLRREHLEEYPEELTQIPPHWRNIYLDYVWNDEEGNPLSEVKREYFRDADALHRRRAELEDEYALIIDVNAPKSPPMEDTLII